MNIFKRRDNFFISHRGFQPLAPENSLPSFYYAGLLGQWAIETDVRFTRDGEAICCHNEDIEKYCNVSGIIEEMSYQEISLQPIVRGSRVDCFTADERRIPKFSEYLAICRHFGSVPFIELKNDDVEKLLSTLHKCGFSDTEVVISSVNLSDLYLTRKLSSEAFIHWIFADEMHIEKYADLGNAGLSFKISNPLDCAPEKIKRAQSLGLKVCLRAADSLSDLKHMQALGLDYFPTNTLHKKILKGIVK